MLKDPVCGVELEEKEAQERIEYKRQICYFCSDRCKVEFIKNPEKYYFIMRRYNWIKKNSFR